MNFGNWWLEKMNHQTLLDQMKQLKEQKVVQVDLEVQGEVLDNLSL